MVTAVAKQTICQAPACVNGATQTVLASGTMHGRSVCDDDVAWAKQQLAEDFPGRAIERERIPVVDDWQAEYDAARAEIRAQRASRNDTDEW